MKIQLEQLGDEPLDWQEDLEIPLAELGASEVKGLSPVAAQGNIKPVYPGYLLQASLAYTQEVCCDRCLCETQQPVAVDFSLLLLVGDQSDDAEVELEADDLDIVQLPTPEFDTRPPIVEQVQLQIPMKPICKADCQGLCSRCGKDLNDGPCACQEEADPRWAALAGLKQRLGD